MSMIDKLKSLNLNDDDIVNFTLSEGTDVFVHNETEVETALCDTDVVETLSSFLSEPGLKAYSAWGNYQTTILEDLRDEGHLDDYERDFTFPEYLTSLINENFYDLELVDYSVEKYDHKRGFCTLTAEVNVPFGNLLEARPYISDSWTVQVKTPAGTLTVE